MQAGIHHNSSVSSPVASANLSPAQTRVIAALTQGCSVTAAAREAGIHRTTIHHWLRSEPQFKTALETAQREYVATLSDEMRDLAARALQTLHTLLEDPNTPPAVRLKTALAILERPQFPNQGWRLPERIESAREQELLDGLAELEADYRAVRMTDAIEAADRQTEPAAPAPIARSAPCPCGSGRKYKRCCGIASPGALPAP